MATTGSEPSLDPSIGVDDLGDGAWVDPALTADPAVAPQGPGMEPMAPAAPIGTAWIAGTNGDGAVCRAGADFGASELGTLPEGTSVEVAGSQAGDWMPVNCSGTVGYVSAQFLAWEQPTAPLTTEPTLDPALSTDVAMEPAAEIAPPVALAAEIAPPIEEPVAEPVLEPSLAPGGGRRGGGGSGQAVADFAMGFVGFPYVYAGAGPDAFDCSGFTMYVVQQTLGIDITHDMFTQIGMGQSVGRGELQPGDLVFFENTFRPGLSHNGVYIGGGQFVHAENESTGVRVSDINSDYYSSRFYGAVRIG